MNGRKSLLLNLKMLSCSGSESSINNAIDLYIVEVVQIRRLRMEIVYGDHQSGTDLETMYGKVLILDVY
jgi:hypothetical protein